MLAARKTESAQRARGASSIGAAATHWGSGLQDSHPGDAAVRQQRVRPGWSSSFHWSDGALCRIGRREHIMNTRHASTGWCAIDDTVNMWWRPRCPSPPPCSRGTRSLISIGNSLIRIAEFPVSTVRELSANPLLLCEYSAALRRPRRQNEPHFSENSLYSGKNRPETGSTGTATTTIHPSENRPSFTHLTLCRDFCGLQAIHHAFLAGFVSVSRKYAAFFGNVSAGGLRVISLGPSRG